MKRRIKVLQLFPDYNVKSSDISDLGEQIVKGLPRDQFEVTCAYFSGKPNASQPHSIAEHVYYFDIPDSQMRGLRLKALCRLYRFCKTHQFDVVICNRFKVVSMLLQVNKLLHIPLCIGVSHVLNEYHRPYRRYQVKLLADKHWYFIGVSDAVKNNLIEYGGGFHANNTYAIPNAIDIAKAEASQLSKEAARDALGLPQNKRIIGAIGQLFSRKGHRFLISALARIHHQYPDVHIGIIGKGPEENNLKEQIMSLGLESKVHLLGFRTHALQYVRAFDIWAMPSLKEGLPLALMEGISGRLPVIASDIPEMRDVIIGTGGIATPPKDVDSLSQALTELLSLDQSQLEEKGEAGFRYLATQHSIEAYRQAYRSFIEEKLKEVKNK
ncbi:glycosyltransferase family 4 protein [Methylobacillus sp.]|uniref:glycosyltransferase family 4 protein n=1 Tax=Methylobacillus sp. TaxID=56818 RepID=UPI0012BFEB43|nr:glycosyltransferase family 4 protein [Methylobacillus sp.]MPS49695.1 glycosyltransferase family 1 protein [Methylobacillus sp.]